MSSEKENRSIVIVDVDTILQDFCTRSPEAVRQFSRENLTNTSFENVSLNRSNKASDDVCAPAPPNIVSEMSPIKNCSSTQTESPIQEACKTINLSFFKDFNLQESLSKDNSENSFGSKRLRRDSQDDSTIFQPNKKTKHAMSTNTYSEDEQRAENAEPEEISLSSSQMSSVSDVSFKSVVSNLSFKVRKRRPKPKSDSNLVKEALQRSRKCGNLSRNLATCEPDIPDNAGKEVGRYLPKYVSNCKVWVLT